MNVAAIVDATDQALTMSGVAMTKQIMLIDDHEDIKMILRMFFEIRDYTGTVTSSQDRFAYEYN